jgi:Zn-dependent protease with chaperone function
VLKKTAVLDKNLSKEISSIIGNPFDVYIFRDKAPNAFAIGGRNIFITMGAKKLFNDREIIAILIHEAYHNLDRHIHKKIFAKYPLVVTAVTAATSIAIVTGIAFPAMLTYIIMRNLGDVIINRIQGRKQEISADKATVRYGYGDDLISALRKLEKEYIRQTAGQKCGSVCEFVNKINSYMDEHPSVDERVERLFKAKELWKAAVSKNFMKIKKTIQSLVTNYG